jgi:hypothetical protein
MLILWECHVCNWEFETRGGGVCAKCRRPACSGHLRKQRDSTYLCTPCLKAPQEGNESKDTSLVTPPAT